MKRFEWIDSCRFFAIFVIMVTHFIAAMRPEILDLWEQPPSSWLLYGLTGKFSVAFFFVILGYFASKPSKFSIKAFISYSLRRYFQFVFYIFICTTVYILGCYAVTWIFHNSTDQVLRVISDGAPYNVIYLLRDSLLFEDNYNATLWCMQQLFISSLLCKVFSYIPEKTSLAARISFALLAIAVMMLANAEFFVWICAAVLGYILRLCLEWLEQKPSLKNRAAIITMLLICLVLIKIHLNEGALQYSLQSIAAFLLILAQFHMPTVQRALSRAPLPWLGGISMGLFVTHTPVYTLLHDSIYQLLLRVVNKTISQFIYFVISVIVCIFCSWLLKILYSAILKIFSKEPVSV